MGGADVAAEVTTLTSRWAVTGHLEWEYENHREEYQHKKSSVNQLPSSHSQTKQPATATGLRASLPAASTEAVMIEPSESTP